jgi:hypothetical protein
MYVPSVQAGPDRHRKHEEQHWALVVASSSDMVRHAALQAQVS